MKAFFRGFLFKLLSRPIVRAIGWTEQERAAFDLFCRTSCGQKLFEYLRQVVATTTFNAVYRESVSANYYARGQQDTLALLHRLRVFPLEESDWREFEDSEQPTAAQGVPAKGSDHWRWLGGRGAIG